jgi:hypothetical protein
MRESRESGEVSMISVEPVNFESVNFEQFPCGNLNYPRRFRADRAAGREFSEVSYVIF